MKGWNELELQGLHWETENGWGFKPVYQLMTAAGEVVATMRRTHWWNNRVEIDSVGNRFLLDRKGFLPQRIEVQSIGTGESPATFIYELLKGRLDFDDGRTYIWRSSNWWGTKWAWTTEEGVPLIGFEVQGMFKQKGLIHVDNRTFSLDKPPLLLFLGWYLIMLYYQDAAAAG